MKIALTGASSTGKTTIAKKLLDNDIFKKLITQECHFFTVDARSILRANKFLSIDCMTINEKKQFQYMYLKKKLEQEGNQINYLTDRSFVDLAAYWYEIDIETLNSKESNDYYTQCKKAALQYDIHFYFPFDVIRFDEDGYRSTNMDYNKKIDNNILRFLNLWNINYIIINQSDINGRINIILNEIMKFL